MKYRLLHNGGLILTLLWVALGGAGLRAQEEMQSRKFRIVDGYSGGTTQFDRAYDGYYAGKILSDGMTPPPAGMTTLTDVSVYVVAEQFADTVISWQRTNRRAADGDFMIRKFYDYYRQRYKLRPASDGTYDLRDAWEYGKSLQKEFPDFFEYWGITWKDINLIVVCESTPDGSRVGTGVAEKHLVRNIIDYWESAREGELICNLYFLGANEAETAQKEHVTRMYFNQSSIQVGNQLRFPENFEIAGSTSERLVIDRYIETCRFEEDYDRILTAYESKLSGNAFERAKTYVGAIMQSEDTTTMGIDRLNPYVFSGILYDKAMYRRTGGDLSRDTMEYFRRLTEQAFAMEAHRDEYVEVAGDSVTVLMEYNLFNHYLYKYNSFWNAGFNFLDKLPRDGGEEDDMEADPRYYEIRTDKKTAQALQDYIDRGKRLKRDEEGYVGATLNVTLRQDRSIEYLVKPFYADVLRGEGFRRMVADGTASILSRQSDGTVRVRIKSRDYRTRFQKLFEAKSVEGERLYLSLNTIKKKSTFAWTMPDPNKYYHMRHVNYLHDFTHVDTSSTDCDCTRTNDLRFITLSSEPAEPDCPPLGGNGMVEDYRPRSKKGEESSVDRSAYLQFDLGSAALNVSLGDNHNQLDTLRNAAFQIMNEEGTGNRIDSIVVIGISSPEGASYDGNKALSGRRAASVAAWVGGNCDGSAYAARRIVDSVATWMDVADKIDALANAYATDTAHRFPAYADTALAKSEARRIRQIVAGDNPHNTTAQQRSIGYSKNNEIITIALEQLRKTNVRFVYKATMDPSEELIIDIYKNGGSRELYGAYFYYILLKSDKVSHEEKLRLCDEIIRRPRNEKFLKVASVESATADQWFDLIRPLAANIIAVDSIKAKKWDTSILAPYISMEERLQRINAASQSLDNNKYYRYVNADFVVYNQIQMLLGLGDEASLQRADSLIQMFAKANVSNEFRDKYRPHYLSDVIQCYYSKAFVSDTALANRIKSTNLINFFVINMSIAHEQYYGSGMYTTSAQNYIRECYDSIPALQRLTSSTIERLYFTAVTEGRYGDVGSETGSDDPGLAAKHKEEHVGKAIDALVALFKENPDFIGICQGDRYIRGIYRDYRKEREKYDYYLEAVEKYIDDWMMSNNE